MTLGPAWTAVSLASTGPRSRPFAKRWTNPRMPGYEVRHCGHPTALRPYYVLLDGSIVSDTFRHLDKAKAWTEAHALDNGRWVSGRELMPETPAGALI